MPLPEAPQNALVIGGGFFGTSVAVHLARRGWRVTVIERESAPMQRASLRNQARVHAGYHYPRSLVTALRSIINYPRFRQEFAECISAEFQAYYPIARHGSKVSARQFAAFCKRIQAPVQRAPASVARLFQPSLVEEVFAVDECAFDGAKLAAIMSRRLAEHGVLCAYSTEALRLTPGPAEHLTLTVRAEGEEHPLQAPWVFNCTYAQLNFVPAGSTLALIPLRHEMTEMALIRPPEELRDKGVTVMCGPYFSTMPYPSRGLHTLSHVRYTPHRTWSDATTPATYTPAEEHLTSLPRETAFPFMVADAARYLPCLRRAEYVDSLWETKTVLPLSEVDDSRPILFQQSRELPGLVSVMGGKVDNIFDIEDELDLLLHAAR